MGDDRGSNRLLCQTPKLLLPTVGLDAYGGTRLLNIEIPAWRANLYGRHLLIKYCTPTPKVSGSAMQHHDMHPSDTETKFALADVLHAPLFADVKLGRGCQRHEA